MKINAKKFFLTKKSLYLCAGNDAKTKTNIMKNPIIKNLEIVITQLDQRIGGTIDIDKLEMLKRAREESMKSLTTLTYIYQ